jgi:hypothetical protein
MELSGCGRGGGSGSACSGNLQLCRMDLFARPVATQWCENVQFLLWHPPEVLNPVVYR